MISSFALVLPLLAATLSSALDYPVVVGGPGLLAYTPPTVQAKVGDTITFEFHEKNHSVTQAAFDSPCSPLGGGFDSGLMPVAPGTTSGFPTYTVTVKDDKPIWAYCKQPGPPAHCQSGMVFAANAPSSGNTFDAFKTKAIASGSSTTNGSSTSTATSVSSSSTGSPKDHLVVVGGSNLLSYTPPTVNAAVGDTITFEFHEKNHTVTQAAFDTPCSPLGSGFDSGFMPVARGTTYGFPTYTVTVEDDKPIWAYCRQKGPPVHCQSGMVFAANAPSYGNTFDAFETKAIASGSSTTNGSSTSTATSASSSSTGSPKDHRVVVGGPGLLAYTPPTVNASVGDTITFEFHEKNHSITQAAFDSPCSPLGGGFDSGLMPVAPGTTSGFPTYTVTVKDDKPIWAYCKQPGPPAHCQSGMVFAANAPSYGNTFDAFRNEALALNKTSTGSGSYNTDKGSYTSDSGGSYNSGSVLYTSGSGGTYSPGSGSYNTDSESYTSGSGGSHSSGWGGSYTSAVPSAVTVTVTKTITESDSTYTTTYTTTTPYSSAPASATSAASSDSGSGSRTPVTHTVVVGGSAGLVFTPNTVVAATGDIVEFQFQMKNHSVTQSPFSNPCTNLEKASNGTQVGFDSGFMPVATDAKSFPTFKVTVNDTKPIWGYCRQQGAPVHCQQGMVFGINAPTSGANTFAAFQQLAIHTNATVLSAPST